MAGLHPFGYEPPPDFGAPQLWQRPCRAHGEGDFSLQAEYLLQPARSVHHQVERPRIPYVVACARSDSLAAGRSRTLRRLVRSIAKGLLSLFCQFAKTRFMLKNANVLVTGGTGFIGVNLIRRLLELGASVTTTLHRRDP